MFTKKVFDQVLDALPMMADFGVKTLKRIAFGDGDESVALQEGFQAQTACCEVHDIETGELSAVLVLTIMTPEAAQQVGLVIPKDVFEKALAETESFEAIESGTRH